MKEKIKFEKPDFNLTKDFFCVDLHNHTVFSDGTSTIKQVLEKIKKLNIGVSITDHNEIKGSLELRKELKKNKLNNLLIPGIEVKSDENIDILFYFYSYEEMIIFYDKEIKKNKKKYFHSTKTTLSVDKLYELSKKYKCLTNLAHPYGYNLRAGKKLFEIYKDSMIKFENIEVINGGNNRKDNLKALNLCNNLKKGFTGGSDSHTIHSLGNILTCVKKKELKEESKIIVYFLDSIKNKENFVVGNENSHGKIGEYFRYGYSKLKNIFLKK
ncbi:MAG: PHP domain-containing protein [Candidatus Woesearchaeota archaeon]